MPDGRTCRAGPQLERPYSFVHDCLFPDLAGGWRELLEAAEHLAPVMSPDEDAIREAEQRVRRVVLMAHADGLEASGRTNASDDIALRVGRHMVKGSEGTDG